MGSLLRVPDSCSGDPGIVREYPYKPLVWMLEYHGEGGRLALDRLLRDEYILAKALVNRPDYGELVYISRSMFKPAVES